MGVVPAGQGQFGEPLEAMVLGLFDDDNRQIVIERNKRQIQLVCMTLPFPAEIPNSGIKIPGTHDG